jgi:hypothetical protein
VLPGGFTSWAFAHALRLSSTSALLQGELNGPLFSYNNFQRSLSLGAATTETAISVSAISPPIAQSHLLVAKVITSGSGAPGAPAIVLNPTSGAVVFAVGVVAPSTTAEGRNAIPCEFANVAQTFTYYWQDVANISGWATLDHYGYRLPNGA